MKGYKGFYKGMVCRGESLRGKYEKQYTENTVYEENEAVICNKGMHFCLNPFDVLDYYQLVDSDGNLNEFAEVEALAETHTDDNKKYCTTKLKIGAKITFAGFVKACVDFVFEKIEEENKASGDYAKLAASGEDSVICCAGINGKAKAKKGCWITLSEWIWDSVKDRYIPVCVKTEQVDGERIKEDVYYKLENGEFVEV